MPQTVSGYTIPAGSDAISTIDDTMATMAGQIATNVAAAGALKLINTTTFTGVPSQAINNVFSSTYTNYRIVINASQSGLFGINLRLRVAGVDASGSNYKQQFNRLDSVGTNNGTVTTTTAIAMSGDTVARFVGVLDVFNPFVAASTQFLFLNGVNNSARMGLVEHQVSTSYDGFSLFAGANFTGTVSTYGYNE